MGGACGKYKRMKTESTSGLCPVEIGALELKNRTRPSQVSRPPPLIYRGR
jgi:hypothetical protein